jgi:hypothetical protein
MKKKIPVLSVLLIASFFVTACKTTEKASSLSSLTPSSSPSSLSTASSSLPVSSAYSSSEPVSSSIASPLRKTTTKLYVQVENGVESEDIDVYFLDGHGDVPFLDLSGSESILQRSLNDTKVTTEGKVVTVSREENSATIAFDFAGLTVSYSDLDVFAAGHGKTSCLDIVSNQGTTDSGASKYLKSLAAAGLDTYRKGKSFEIDLGQRNIPMHFEEGHGYLPLQTIVDLILSQRNIYVLYNGVSLYMSGALLPDEMQTSFYSAPAKERSHELAEFSYQELLLALDFQYGLKKEHGISDFATFLPQAGLKEKLLSTDPLVADKAVEELCRSAFSDYHSALDMTSSYAGADALTTIRNDTTTESPAFIEYQLIRYTYPQARKAVYNALTKDQTTVKDGPDSYEEYGDTAYVTFDQFRMPEDGTDYYTTAPTASATDTYGIIEYAH